MKKNNDMFFQPLATGKMKIRYLSDIHLEFIKPLKLQRLVLDQIAPAEEGEICILAGDIGYPESENYDLFMKFVNNHFIKTFVIPGNHEYYNKFKIVEEMDTFMEEYFKQHPNITLLNNRTEKYGDYTFVGTTLWSYIKDPMFSTNDVYQIPNFDYMKCNELNRICIKFLEDSIAKNENCIVITHHLPSKQFIDPKYNTIRDRPYQQWFYSDMDLFIHTYHDKIKYWFYGHTHTASKNKVNNILFLCNPIGYPGENNKVELNKTVLLH
jgi:predicted phosphodiesterase